MRIDFAQARRLATASELELVDASKRGALTKLSPAELRRNVSRTRALRDKWREQAEKQRRQAQHQTGQRETAESGRTRKKAELFAEVLRRFEEQLQKTGASGEAAGRRPAGKTPSRAARTRAHRDKRAGLKAALENRRLGGEL